MKVILMSDLRHRGRRGQVVEVKSGYARNYLFPQGFAMEATPGNLKRFEQERIAGLRLQLAKRAMETGALYGSVTATDVVEALAAKGVEIDRRQVDLAGGIKTIGDHVVRIDLHAEVIAELAVTVEAEE